MIFSFSFVSVRFYFSIRSYSYVYFLFPPIYLCFSRLRSAYLSPTYASLASFWSFQFSSFSVVINFLSWMFTQIFLPSPALFCIFESIFSDISAIIFSIFCAYGLGKSHGARRSELCLIDTPRRGGAHCSQAAMKKKGKEEEDAKAPKKTGFKSRRFTKTSQQACQISAELTRW